MEASRSEEVETPVPEEKRVDVALKETHATQVKSLEYMYCRFFTFSQVCENVIECPSTLKPQ